MENEQLRLELEYTKQGEYRCVDYSCQECPLRCLACQLAYEYLDRRNKTLFEIVNKLDENIRLGYLKDVLDKELNKQREEH